MQRQMGCIVYENNVLKYLMLLNCHLKKIQKDRWDALTTAETFQECTMECITQVHRHLL